MNNPKFVSDHPEYAIGKEVHVVGWGSGPFFTVRNVLDGHAHLSTRYQRRVKYVISADRCYFTKRCLKQLNKELEK